MNKAVDSIRKGLRKRIELMEKYRASRSAFLKTRETILEEIEAAREIWKKTSEHLIK